MRRKPIPKRPPHREPSDPVGAETLEQLSGATRYNRWMFDRIRGWMRGRILEIGSGIGNLSAFLVEAEHVVLTDTREEYLERLRARFAKHPNIDVVRLYLPNEHGALEGRRFDTIICLNVLEHVDDDVGSLAAIRGLLAPGGRLVLLVPALPALFGTMDRALGHHRRYTRAGLVSLLRKTGFTVPHVEYFNLAGVPGWWFAGRVLRRQMIPARSLTVYDALVPLFRLERLLPWRVGQSLIAVGQVA